MKRKNGRRLACLAGLLAAVLTAFPAAADSTQTGSGATSATASQSEPVDKEFRIVEQDGQGAILTEPLEYAFWEHPLLPAGQERTGSFRITNETMRAVSVTMTPDLPYDDTVAMTYFAGLTVIIWQAEDGTVVYTGPYTGLADTVPLLSINPLRPGDSVEYGITLRCPFTYTGDPQEESSAVSWELSANAQIVTEQGGSPSVGGIVLLIAALLLVAGIILLAVRRSRRRAEPKQKEQKQ